MEGQSLPDILSQIYEMEAESWKTCFGHTKGLLRT